ncbi:MAG: extracellular solute-binding protein [Treponema sp.]|nr:extracellular solute-binding protein [Treponema sp.]
MKKTQILLSVLLSSALIFSACDRHANGNGQIPRQTGPGTGVALVVYTNSGSDGRAEWLEDRAAQAGFRIQVLEAGAAAIQNRLLAELNAPIADVVFGLNAIIWESLIAEDLFIPYVPVWAREVAPGLNHQDGYYHAIVKQGILLVYDLHQVSPQEAPGDWMDFWRDSRFHGRYEFQSALTGGTPRVVISGILTRYADPQGDLGISDEGWREIEAYFRHGRPSETGVDLYAQITNPSVAVQMGQMWSSGVEDRDRQYGTRTGYVVPPLGIPFVVEGVAIVKGTRNTDEARLFVDWFGSAEVQGEWAEMFSTIPANTGAVHRANLFSQEVAALPAQSIDWALVARNIDAWVERIMLHYMP